MRKSFDGKKQTIGTEQFISKLSFEAANKTQPFLFLKQCLLRLGSQGKVQDFKHLVTSLGISGWWPARGLVICLFLPWAPCSPVSFCSGDQFRNSCLLLWGSYPSVLFCNDQHEAAQAWAMETSIMSGTLFFVLTFSRYSCSRPSGVYLIQICFNSPCCITQVCYSLPVSKHNHGLGKCELSHPGCLQPWDFNSL